jgi:hypothetical protein
MTESWLGVGGHGLTAEVIDSVLRARGVLTTGRVVGFSACPIGTGQMAESTRLTLEYDGPSDGPASLVAKSASKDPGSRAVGKAFRAYEVEVRFYRELAPTLGINCPASYLAEIDLEATEFLLLLEDLAPAVAGDDLAGCALGLAERLLEEAVAFHSPRWGDPTLEAIAWLNRNSPESAAKVSTALAAVFPLFVERFGAELDDDLRGGLERSARCADRWWRGDGGPRTIAHGDLRLDNLMLGPTVEDLWIVDWQTSVLGNGVADISYFLGGSLLPEIRRGSETQLVQDYFDRLRRAGVQDYSWDQCWHQYRWGALHGVFLTVGAAMLVEQTERGDRMVLTSIDRHMRHVLELEALELVEAG